ncbi:unnamed protein product [Anisakis simplex]|uniref:Uncharacterized protein n=1 Tax=Anisakis simplex TaxID=6269 RepID=A0A0M3JJW7_ANISI|nr:unnamed protein product [Anisakis simplex]
MQKQQYVLDDCHGYCHQICALSDQLHLLVTGVESAMGDRTSNTNMKIDTLAFLSVALCSHAPEVCESLMFYSGAIRAELLKLVLCYYLKD